MVDGFSEEFFNLSQLPDVLLIKKKVIKDDGKRKWKLKHLNKEQFDDTVEINGKNTSKKNKKGEKNKRQDEAKEYEEFLKEIDEDDELREKIEIFPVNNNIVGNDENVLLEIQNNLNQEDTNKKKILIANDFISFTFSELEDLQHFSKTYYNTINSIGIGNLI